MTQSLIRGAVPDVYVWAFCWEFSKALKERLPEGEYVGIGNWKHDFPSHIRLRDSRHVIALDEPEIGLADEYALALGKMIVDFAMDLPPLCDALIIVSHNRSMVGELLCLKPQLLRFGGMNTSEWLSTPPKHEVGPLPM